MVDVHDKKTRSFNMSRIRGCNTRPETYVRSELHRRGFRFRINVKELPGKPDLLFPKYRKAVFVHGCFWHQHFNCQKSHMPKSNLIFWKSKLKKNVLRDRRNEKHLREKGWEPLIIWECELRKGDDAIQKLAEKIITCPEDNC